MLYGDKTATLLQLYQSWLERRKCFATQKQYEEYENGAHRQILLRVLNKVRNTVSTHFNLTYLETVNRFSLPIFLFNFFFLNLCVTQALHSVQATDKELGDYEPHVYAEEGVEEAGYKLDAIPLPDITFDSNMDLDHRFKDLASVSMTHESFSNTKTFITNESSSSTETTMLTYESANNALESKNTYFNNVIADLQL